MGGGGTPLLFYVVMYVHRSENNTLNTDLGKVKIGTLNTDKLAKIFP